MNEETLTFGDLDAALKPSEPKPPAPVKALDVVRVNGTLADTSGNVITAREIFNNMDAAVRLAAALAVCVGSGPDASKQAFARIHAGAELGLPPMAAIRMVHFIKGRTALSADGMVAVCMARGVTFKVTHSQTPGEWCEVSATRAGSSYAFRWTIDMARKAGLAGGDNWKNYPWDMLYARAASHVCRKIAPDIIGGIHMPEELEAPATDTGAVVDALGGGQ